MIIKAWNKIKFPTKKDHHIKGHMNWWEDVIQPQKKRARQKATRDIQRELKNE